MHLLRSWSQHIPVNVVTVIVFTLLMGLTLSNRWIFAVSQVVASTLRTLHFLTMFLAAAAIHAAFETATSMDFMGHGLWTTFHLVDIVEDWSSGLKIFVNWNVCPIFASIVTIDVTCSWPVSQHPGLSRAVRQYSTILWDNTMERVRMYGTMLPFSKSHHTYWDDEMYFAIIYRMKVVEDGQWYLPNTHLSVGHARKSREKLEVKLEIPMMIMSHLMYRIPVKT